MVRRPILLLASLVLLITLVGGGWLWQRSSTKTPLAAPTVQNSSSSVKQAEIESSIESRSEVPFAELTIPYLRERIYQSQLASLELIAEGSQFDSFLTSYVSDGFKVNGLLTIPTGQPPAGGWPAIVFVHGYIPPANYLTTEKYVDYVNYLARSGFVVFKIDLRGHGDSEGEANGAYYSSDYVIDTLNARAALQNSSFVNPAKIGFWGHSMAGNVVFRSLAAQPTIPAIVIWAGAVYSYTDWQQYGLSDHSYVLTQQRRSDREARRQALYDAHGQFSSMSSFWRQVVPTNYLADIRGTVQLHHAVDDSVVNIGYSRDLVTLLEQTAIPHEFYEYPSGGHNIAGSSFSLAMQRTVAFFSQNL